MSNPFSEDRLDLGIHYGTVGGPSYSTTVITDGSGAEQRNANWAQPLGQWSLGNKNIDQAELNYLVAFHQARKGAWEGFRLRDWADYQGLGQSIGIGDGSTTTYQLIKTYRIGAFATSRPIHKPVVGTVSVRVNGVISGGVVDHAAGLVTLSTAPAVGAVITADYEFDVPVRFVEDQISYRYLARAGDDAIFELDQLTCTEIRQPLPILPSSALPSHFDHTIDLGIDLQTVGGPTYQTQISRVGSWERRDSHWVQPLGRYLLGDRSLTSQQADYFIALFRLCRGRAGSFLYQDPIRDQPITVRFAEDRLAIRFDAYNDHDGEAIYTLSSLGVAQIRQPILPAIKRYTVVVRFNFNTGGGDTETHPIEIIAPLLGIRTEYYAQHNANDSKRGYIVHGGGESLIGGGSYFGINGAGLEGSFEIESVSENN